MNATLSTLLCSTALVLLAAPDAAQQTRSGKTGSRTPVEASPASRSACGHVACAEGVIDQGTDRPDKPSSTADEFNVYASGGVRMFTNSAATTGAALAPGSGTWSMLSDRDAKENVEPVDARAVLDGVVALPLATWNYEEQDDSIRHMGPMAQDFHAAFGLGVSERLIDVVDSGGVALAAIQGLHALVQEKDAEIAELRARLDRIEAGMAR